jgi:hypothetical protein
MVTCIGTTLTTAADWEAGLTDFSSYTGTGSVVLSASPTFTGNVAISTVTSGTWNATQIGAAYGGTGQTSYTAGDIIYASGTTAISKLGIGTAGQALVVNSGATAPAWTTLTLENLPGAWVKKSVRAATIGSNITLSAGAPNSLDGVTLALNDRILVKDQTSSQQNGIYYVSTLGTGSNGTWTRATDADTAGEIAAAMVAVDEGTTNGGFTYDNDFKATDTLGTTAMAWSRVLDSSSTLTAGNLSGTIPSAVLGNSTAYIGTTAVTLNRASAGQGLTGITSIGMNGATSGTITVTPTATAGSNTITLPAITGTALVTSGTTATAGYFDTGSTGPSGTTRLNYGGYLYATRLQSDGYYSITGAAAAATLFSDITTGSVAIGNAITTGTIYIGTGGTGASSISIGRSGSTTTISGTLVATISGYAQLATANTFTASNTLRAGTATAGTAPLYFQSGTNLTTAVAGAMEFDGTRLYFSPSTTRKAVALTDSAGTTLDSAITASSLTSVGTLANLSVTNTITGSVSGNAGTVTNGVYTNGSYSDPTWITAINATKISTGSGAVSISSAAANNIAIQPGTTGTLLLGTTSTGTVGIGNSSAVTTVTGSTVTLTGATVTMSSATTLNVNGSNPTLASSSTGTLTLFNTNLLTVNAFAAATTLSLGYTGSSSATTNIAVATPGSTTTNAVNIATGLPAAGGTRTVNIATGAQSAGTTNVNIGTGMTAGTGNITIGSGTSTLTLWGTASLNTGGFDVVNGNITTSSQSNNPTTTGGVYLGNAGKIHAAVNGGTVMQLNRNTSDGEIVGLYQAATLEGSISVSGTTVTYGSFAGTHWSQFENNSRPDILPGTVLEATGFMCEWDGEENDQLSQVKISDTEDSNAVYGVFMHYDNDDADNPNDVFVLALGAWMVRVDANEDVAVGDLLSSKGNGCAKIQSDDIVRSRTIGKVTSNVPTVIYEDGSKLIPCVLYCG